MFCSFPIPSIRAAPGTCTALQMFSSLVKQDHVANSGAIDVDEYSSTLAVRRLGSRSIINRVLDTDRLRPRYHDVIRTPRLDQEVARGYRTTRDMLLRLLCILCCDRTHG